MSKICSSGQELNSKVLAGANKLADLVACTLGPRGNNVILKQKDGTPIITKDGVTVSKFVDLDDPFENAGAQILKQASAQTNTNAGDGTTTSTVLARELLNESQRFILAGASTTELKRGMDIALRRVLEELKGMSRPVESLEEIESVATISANGDELIGRLISEAVEMVGNNGAIAVEEAKSLDTSLDVIEGFQFDSGYFSTSFISNQRRASVEYEECLVMVTDHKIDQVSQVLPVLELAARDGRPFVIVAEQIEGQALAALIMNAVRGSMRVAAVKAPGYGEERSAALEDLSLSIGATFVSARKDKALCDVQMSDLGTCKSVEILKNKTTFVGGLGNNDAIQKRTEMLKELVKQTDDIVECEKIQQRITRLASGVALIKVGASTDIEMIEKKHRIEDALEAVTAAQEEGIVPGGGVALARCRHFDTEDLSGDRLTGAMIVRNSLIAPIKQMSANAGLSYEVILNKLDAASLETGWDFAGNDLVDMYAAGIIDPTKVTRNALANAISVSSTLITTAAAVIEEK
jgi:chaperonin GroEL